MVIAVFLGTHVARAQGGAALDSSANPLTVALPKIKLPELNPRPGYIIGRAIFENGRPIPEFQVTAYGYSNTAYQGQVSLNGFSDLGFKGLGKGGSYAIKAYATGAVDVLVAAAKIRYQGKLWTVDLWPTDNKPNGRGIGDFQGIVDQGVVRDFVFRQSGLRPRSEADADPKFGVGPSYYGGTLCLTTIDSREPFLRSRETFLVEVTLVPTGPMLDGSKGKTITRTTVFGRTMLLHDIPIGRYTMTARFEPPSKQYPPDWRMDLRMTVENPYTADNYRSAVDVHWEQAPDGSVFPCTRYVTYMTRYEGYMFVDPDPDDPFDLLDLHSLAFLSESVRSRDWDDSRVFVRR